MTKPPEKRSLVTYEDAPAEVYRDLVRLVGTRVNVSIPATIKAVGSKAVVLEVETLYGEYRDVSVPIANLVVNV